MTKKANWTLQVVNCLLWNEQRLFRKHKLNKGIILNKIHKEISDMTDKSGLFFLTKREVLEFHLEVNYKRGKMWISSDL